VEHGVKCGRIMPRPVSAATRCAPRSRRRKFIHRFGLITTWAPSLSVHLHVAPVSFSFRW
jgi:hypothetical protein